MPSPPFTTVKWATTINSTQPSDSVPLAAIVLAGGKSRRMGQDKALLEIGGMPLLRRVCLVALHCTPRVYVVTSRIEQYKPILPDACQLLREVLLPGEMEPQGPLVGFARAMSQISTDWVLLLACDLPNLDATVLQTWMGQLEEAEGAVALLPSSQKGWEPLCGFYHSSCLSSLNDFIQQGGRSFQPWLAQQLVKPLPLEHPSLLFNCNTPADLAGLIGQPVVRQD